MLFVVLQLGNDRYAIDSMAVVEILPVVKIKPIPGAAQGVAGVFRYHGQAVPVIDLAAMALGVPSQRRMSTRIILVRYPEEGGTRLLGLIAERATATLRCQESDFSHAGISSDETPYLGPVTSVGGGIVQWVKVDRLLSSGVREQLFREPAEAH